MAQRVERRCHRGVRSAVPGSAMRRSLEVQMSTYTPELPVDKPARKRRSKGLHPSVEFNLESRKPPVEGCVVRLGIVAEISAALHHFGVDPDEHIHEARLVPSSNEGRA